MTDALPPAAAPPGGALVVKSPAAATTTMQQDGKRTNPWPWIALGCVVALGAVAGFIFVLVTVVVGAMRSSEPYATAMQRAQRDPRVVAALGSPIEPGLFVSGSIKVENRDGSADLEIPISGPKQKASISVVGTKFRGRWSYQEMIVTPANGPEIDLRTSSERSPNTATPAE